MSEEESTATSSLAGRVVDLLVSAIEPNPYQPRHEFPELELEELAASIRRHGVLQPIVVREHGVRYQLVAGERRLRAARMAGKEYIPARLCTYTDAQMLEVALVENLQRQDISALEAAEAYRQLIEQFGLTQEQVAGRVGKSRSAVANTLRLLKLPLFIQDSLRSTEITEGHARALVSVTDREQQKKLWEGIVLAGASVREAEEMARSPQDVSIPVPPLKRPSLSSPDPNLAAVESALRQVLGTRVTLTPGRRGGTISISYFGDEDLERIIGVIVGSEIIP